jgi:hypothetical protein
VFLPDSSLARKETSTGNMLYAGLQARWHRLKVLAYNYADGGPRHIAVRNCSIGTRRVATGIDI